MGIEENDEDQRGIEDQICSMPPFKNAEEQKLEAGRTLHRPRRYDYPSFGECKGHEGERV